MSQSAAVDGRHRLVRRSVRTEHVVAQHVFTAAASLRSSFRQRDIVGLRHRTVVVHFHRERAFRRIARGVRHADGDFARQLVRMVVTACGGCMRSFTVQRVAIVHRPRAVRSLRRAGHRHGNAVHRHHAARHIGSVAGNGHLPAAFTAHGDHTVFAVQIHRERTATGNAVFRMLAGTADKRAFVHHDVGVARFRRLHRHHRHVLIAPDGDGQCRLRRIAVRIRDGIGEFFRNALALRHVHTGV